MDVMVSETLHRHRRNKGAYSTYYKNFLAVFIGYTPGARYFGHIPQFLRETSNLLLHQSEWEIILEFLNDSQ